MRSALGEIERFAASGGVVHARLDGRFPVDAERQLRTRGTAGDRLRADDCEHVAREASTATRRRDAAARAADERLDPGPRRELGAVTVEELAVELRRRRDVSV